MLYLNPEPTERAKIIFQEACSVENMEAKFGKTLTKEENNIKRYILSQTPVIGRIPSVEEITKKFSNLPKNRVHTILNNLDQVDVIFLDRNEMRIMAAYPFSGTKTAHVVTLKQKKYKKIYAMCAIDALGICFMFNCDVFIESRCYHCEERIQIEIMNNQITSLKPDKLVVWCDREYGESCCAATTLCKNINFYSSEQHFSEWQKKEPKRKGDLLNMQEAFYLGKLFFENRL